MEFFALLIFLACLMMFVGSIMGFVANSRIARLEQHIKTLNRRLDSLINNEGSAKSRSSVAAKTITPTKSAPVAAVKTAHNPAMAQAIKKQTLQPKTLKPKKPKWNFEEELGARWAVWVGGVALLLGAVFLLRYTIESGFFTPQMRILMAGLLGAGLLATGEWARRNDIIPAKAKSVTKSKTPTFLENSYIPGVLTAVGIFTLLGTVYAAHELYAFIGAIPAFALMAIISLGALALGLLHGPWISALGLVASFATPLLIQTEAPNVYALFGYLSIISLVALALANYRQWGWLDLATFGGGIFWIFMGHGAAETIPHLWVWLAFFTGLFTASTFVAARPKSVDFKLGEIPLIHTPISAIGISSLLAIALLTALGNSDHSLLIDGAIAVGFVLALTGSALYRATLIGNTLIAAVFAALYFGTTLHFDELSIQHYIIGLVFAAIIGGGLFWMLRKPKETQGKFWPYLGAIAPTLILWISENHAAEYPNLTPAISFIIAALLLLASMNLRTIRQDQAHKFSAYPWGSAFAYWLGVVALTDGLSETIGLAAGVAVFTALHLRLKWISLRWIALAFAIITLVQIFWLEVPNIDLVSSPIIFNRLWIYFAMPAFLCFAASILFEKTERDLPSEALKALSLIFGALFFIFQIRHAMNDGVITSGDWTFDEISLQVLIGLCFTLGGVLMNIPNAKIGPKVDDKFMQFIPVLLTGISYLTLALFAGVICLLLAPLLNENTVIKGGPIFNTLILGYALPAILMGAIIWFGRLKRPDHYLKLLAGLASISGLLYLTSEIRRLYSGAQISIFDQFPEGLETYTISASWLVLGIILLFTGHKFQSKSLRIASALVIVLTVLKAFLVDMATLEGVLRAMSFVVLGIVLIIIGRVYQNLLFRPGTPDP